MQTQIQQICKNFYENKTFRKFNLKKPISVKDKTFLEKTLMEFDSADKIRAKLSMLNKNTESVENVNLNQKQNLNSLNSLFLSKDDNQISNRNTMDYGVLKMNEAKKTFTPTGNESPPLFMNPAKIGQNKNDRIVKGSTSFNFISNYAKNPKSQSKDQYHNSEQITQKRFTDEANDYPKLRSEITVNKDIEERKESAKKMKINPLAKSNEIIASISGKCKIFVLILSELT